MTGPPYAAGSARRPVSRSDRRRAPAREYGDADGRTPPLPRARWWRRIATLVGPHQQANPAIQSAQSRLRKFDCVNLGPTVGRDSHPRWSRTGPASPGLVTLSHPVKARFDGNSPISCAIVIRNSGGRCTDAAFQPDGCRRHVAGVSLKTGWSAGSEVALDDLAGLYLVGVQDRLP